MISVKQLWNAGGPSHEHRSLSSQCVNDLFHTSDPVFHLTTSLIDLRLHQPIGNEAIEKEIGKRKEPSDIDVTRQRGIHIPEFLLEPTHLCPCLLYGPLRALSLHMFSDSSDHVETEKIGDTEMGSGTKIILRIMQVSQGLIPCTNSLINLSFLFILVHTCSFALTR